MLDNKLILAHIIINMRFESNWTDYNGNETDGFGVKSKQLIRNGSNLI